MSDDRSDQPIGIGDQGVIPPAPPGTYTPPAALPPLAPPVLPAPDVPPAGMLPPYARPPGPPTVAGAAAAMPMPPAPGAPYPASSSRGSQNGAAVVVITVVIVMVIAVAITALALLVPRDAGPEAGRPAPTFPTVGPLPVLPGGGAQSLEGELETKIAEYKQARDSGALWAKIPDTEFNRTAVSAFLFLLTDMKLAAAFGIDDAKAEEYRIEAKRLEELLLAEEPLGTDIEITFSETRSFRYDGDTGEGGYSDE